MDSLFSSHARSRMQQRGIRPAREGRLSVPLDLLVALAPFAAMLVLWVLED